MNETGPTARPEALVVLGAPRSGTTLLATALAAHPAIALLFEDLEGGMFRVIGGKIPAVKLCPPINVDLDRRRRPAYRLARWNGWLRKNFAYRLPQSRVSLRDMAARAHLKVVCLVRDPTRSLDALRRREHFSDRVGRDVIERTYRIFEAIDGAPGFDTCIVSFDRFVQRPEEQLRRLCDWANIPFHPVMLDAPKLNRLYPEANFRADKSLTSPPDDGAAAPDDARLGSLRRRYDALLARAL